ncbi:MAG: type II toxin-antitoxin system Phd/YefM family antitoxin [Desulfobacteraceae bacterium]|nr:type II toxin-antitoxin system Phd/YefM family antitoxin [Desulfobacteraceae bacterium]
MNTTYISESEITKHLPEYILKSSDSDERFVITKDNKPIAALISIEDFQFIEQKQKGLASVVGKWKDFDEIEDILADISSMREKGGTGRDVSF